MKRYAAVLAGLVVLGLLTGCNSQVSDYIRSRMEGTLYEAGLKEEVRTAFFIYQVKDAYLCSEYYGYVPAEGKVLLVASVRIQNILDEAIPMFDIDFQAQWGEEAEDAYAFPITMGGEQDEIFGERQLPARYEIEVGGVRTGDLVFEIPAGYENCSVSCVDVYSDGSRGDTYFVYFTAKENLV